MNTEGFQTSDQRADDQAPEHDQAEDAPETDASPGRGGFGDPPSE